MVWTNPATLSVAEMVDATYMNTTLRDNLLAVDQHTHSGAAGDGSAGLDGVDSVTLDDITTPAAPGADDTIVYAVAGKLKQRAGVAGSEEEFSVKGHSH